MHSKSFTVILNRKTVGNCDFHFLSWTSRFAGSDWSRCTRLNRINRVMFMKVWVLLDVMEHRRLMKTRSYSMTRVIKLYLPTKIIFSFIFPHLRCFFLQHRRKTSAWIMKLKSHFNFNSENVLFILKSRIMFSISNNICLTKESEI